MKQTETLTKRIGDFRPGVLVRIGKGGYSYMVAEVKQFPHGKMIGIYDEPPSKHIDYWNPESLTIVA